MAGRSLTRGFATLIAAFAVAISACGGAASSPPSPTATPTAAPTPTPFDVGAAFLAIVTGDSLDGTIEMSGTMEMGITAEISGAIDVDGDNSRTEFSFAFGSTKTTNESVEVDGVTYTRSSGGPWLEAEPTSSGGESDENFSTWMRSLEAVEDLGLVTIDGQELHHLKPDKPLPAGAFMNPAMEDPTFTIEMYAKANGSPALFRIEGSWTQDVNGQLISVAMALDMTFSRIGSGPAVRAPTDVWTRYASPLGYSMAHPADFSVENRDGYDAFVKGGEDWFYVTPWPEAKGLSPEGFRDGLIENYAPDWGQPVSDPVATALAGQPGWALAWSFTNANGDTNIAHDVLAMHEDLGWEVTLITLPELETSDLKLFRTALATFAFGD